MYTLSPSKSIKGSNYREFLKDINVLLCTRLYKYVPNLESLLTQQYVCVMCTLWSDNTCVFIRFHSVKNANMQVIWSSAYMFNVYKNQLSRQTGSRNVMGPKTLPTIWDTNMKLVTKYQISTINSCGQKCDEKCAYMFNVYKNQLSRQTGSRNLTGPKMLPTIWYTRMTLVTKYQISAINSYWEKCDEKYLGRTDRGKTVYPLPLREVLVYLLCYIFVRRLGGEGHIASA
jgi:hypothetical protein